MTVSTAGADQAGTTGSASNSSTPRQGHGDAATKGLLARLLGEPLVPFAALGLLIFLWFDVRQGAQTDRIVLPADTREQLIEEFETLTGRSASADDISRLEQSWITEAILFREGLEAGLHLSDPQIRVAVVERMRRDVVGPAPTPDGAALVNFYAEHVERYYTEPAISFRHVFFLNAPPDPAAVLAALRAGEPVEGDGYWQGNSFPEYGESVIRAIFGEPFLRALEATEAGGWTGPLPSSRGLHFVHVDQHHAPRLLPFEQAAGQVSQDYLVDWMEARVDAWLAQRRDDYAVTIEGARP